MLHQSARRIALSLPRRVVNDLLYASYGIPIVTFERTLRLRNVVETRQQLARSAPSWVVIFAKAFALIARQRKELRRIYLPCPWPHLYESPQSIAALAVEREYQGENAVFFSLLKSPDLQDLRQMHYTLQQWKHQPIATQRYFRRCLKYARWPWPVRRGLWWLARSWSGRLNLKYFGTFGLSVTASSGAAAINLIAPVTTTLNYSPFASDGSLVVRMHFDHRVYDGMTAARALAELEEVLHGPILAELRRLKVGWQPDVFAQDHMPEEDASRSLASPRPR